MCSKELLLLACLGLLGGLRLTSTTTTTTFVAAMSIANQDLERYFRSANATQTLATMTEDRIAMDTYTYAFLNYSHQSSEGNQEEISFSEEKARYGEGKIFNVKGKLVHITDAKDSTDDTACSTNLLGTRGDPVPAAGVTWIALVRRGRCTFEEKVKNVHGKGAAGVIIYNDKPVTNLEKMQIKGKTRNITAVITYQEIGVDMARIVDQGIDMNAAIIEGRSGMRPINSLNRTSVLFVSISFIVLMVISLVWLIFYYIQRFRYLQTKDQQSRHLCSVTKKAIMKIPTKTGKSSDEKDADSDCCAICIEAYKAADCIRVLPCKHEFHKSCIDPWLIEHRTCPMCKLDVLKFYGYVFLGSEESILEYEPDRPAAAGAAAGIGGAAAAIAASAVSAAAPAFTGNGLPAAVAVDGGNHLRPPARAAGALADLIRSREFVIDFPRVFVLDAGSATGTRDTLFPARLPERSQSSLSLAQTTAKDWMSQMQNKLEEQQGLRRLRRKSGDRGDDMQENLLSIRADSVKKRRSRSADGRYSHGYFGRKELVAGRQQQQQQLQQQNEAATFFDPGEQRNSSALHVLTEASYAQSRQRQLQQELGPTTSGRRFSIRRGSEISLRQMAPRRASESRQQLLAANANGNESTPPASVAITIQVNGEGVNLE